ncbi:MAG: hypothetical protein AAF753_11690 [Pseudomonadota bacterium]
MTIEQEPNSKPTGSAYLLSLISGLVLASVAIKMFQFPTTTTEPSFINCFNYLGQFESKAMFFAALIIAAATVWLSVLKRRSVVVFIEAMMIWIVAYLALVGASSAPYASSVSGVLQSLTVLGAASLLALIFVRWTVLNEGPAQ